MKKRILCLLLVGILMNSKLYSQYKTDELWISLDNLQLSQQSNGLYTSNIPALNTAMTRYQTKALQQVFPYSKVDRLKKLYKLKFSGESNGFESELKRIPEVKEVVAEAE